MPVLTMVVHVSVVGSAGSSCSFAGEARLLDIQLDSAMRDLIHKS